MQGENEYVNRRGLKMSVIPKRKLLFIIAEAFFLIIFSFWAISSWSDVSVPYQEAVFPWVVVSFTLNFIGLTWAGRCRYTDIALWFVILSYLFMFGHVFTYVFNFTTTLVWDPSGGYTQAAKYHASVYAIAALSSFTLGSLVVSASEESCGRLSAFDSGKFFYIGIICCVVGFACSAISSFSVISATQSAGSYANYTAASSVGLFDDLAYLFVPGVIFLLFCKRLSYGQEIVLFGGSILYFLLVMILSGSRKMSIFAILALLLAYLATRKGSQINAGKILLLCIFGYLFLDLIYVIREMRFSLGDVLPAYIESLQSFGFLGEIVNETLTEAGLIFYSVAGIVQTVPSVFPYEFGMTFVRTIPSILPIGWAVGDFFNEAASTFVINRYLDSPVGASLIGDFYWNWGFAGGCIASAAFGAILSLVRNKTAGSSSLMPLYFSMAYVVLIGVRAGVFELFRPLLMVILVPVVIGAFYSCYRGRKK